ncbi:MAG: hypothetical protein ACRDY2_09115 [Acidimicrobiales bacterium]
MTTRKERVTVSVRPELLVAAQADVANGRAASVSSWVDEAMAARAQQESLQDVLASIRAELGPPTEEETEWARSVLGL